MRRLERIALSTTLWRGLAGIALFIALWEAASLLKVSFLRLVPPPHVVFENVIETVQTAAYWSAVYISAKRVAIGYVIGVLLGVPVGLAFGLSRLFRETFFPVFETLRPIPPLAWVPLSILVWPTVEQTVVSIIFLGCFFTVVINVLGGVETLDIRYVRAALSMGASRGQVFWRVVLPATAPSIFTGMAIAIGLTWEIVVAAEMVSSIGFGQTGLGAMMWQAYVGGLIPLIITAMISIGLAGLAFSALIWRIGAYATRWRRQM
ncbi:MAG TPA: ABC transporter permease [Burkholderiales bacterium]|jgi:NitT/TauT family transport system permease protein|nr:ABC transporter permease [Burkholderiales bacterium]